jgi:2-amino-4-hydroxy-6-hydroxymethyldihydropteridine diphosphokinase
MTTAYIGLGSNLQGPLRQLQTALAAIEQLPDSRVNGVSGIYRSKAVGPGEQPDYLNAVLQLDTRLAPQALLGALQRIEQEQGRVRSVRWGARCLDLDILLYGDSVVASEDLSIPHPRMGQRHFVLYPLEEICGPKLVLPDGTELGTLIACCPQRDLVKTSLRLQQHATVPRDKDRQGQPPDAQ